MAETRLDFPFIRPTPAPLPAPSRLSGLSPLGFALTLAALALIVASLGDVAPSPERLAEGGPRIARLVSRMLPPETDPAFLIRMGWSIVETLQIALVGAFFGVLVSVPFAWASARGVTPFGPFAFLFKAAVSLARTVPDLVWALIFVSAVGLGAVAGTMTVAVDTLGFCGRFFAEAMEETEPEPRQALEAIGANRWGVLFGAVIPDALPSMVNASLFALEKAVRSSVVLGLVGAGGIGQELKTAFDLFQYQKASAIILAVFVIVLAMEWLTDRLRARLR
ncbi:MAG: phosphonate ABC transporter, permease protein PhnE [Pseudomonadota bacterium]|nr:phosphonate ABC transporter, permease protein PhnE [Pseudomonadota bacterium]